MARSKKRVHTKRRQSKKRNRSFKRVGGDNPNGVSAFVYAQRLWSEIKESHDDAEIERKKTDMIDYMFRYSFSEDMNRDEKWKNHIHTNFNAIINTMKNPTEPGKPTYGVVTILKGLTGQSDIRINRFNEKNQSIQAAAVLAYMNYEYCNPPLTLTEFEDKYSSTSIFNKLIPGDEKNKLLEFCNCVRVVICVIPAEKRKEVVLDLVTRLTEGCFPDKLNVKCIPRYVNGTGMTTGTRHRIHIIETEGNLELLNRADPTQRAVRRRAAIDADPNYVKPKRGRPVGSRKNLALNDFIEPSEEDAGKLLLSFTQPTAVVPHSESASERRDNFIEPSDEDAARLVSSFAHPTAEVPPTGSAFANAKRVWSEIEAENEAKKRRTANADIANAMLGLGQNH